MKLTSRAVLAAVLPGLLPAVLGLLSGCATGPKKKEGHVFFPLAPDEPRIQFLTSFSSQDEMGRSGFESFVIGKNKMNRVVAKPYGLTVAQGKIFICDTQLGTVSIADLAKRRLRYFLPPREGALAFPVNIAVDGDGTRYVTDTKRNQVLIYSAKEEYLGALGGKDEMKPAGIGLWKDRIYVTDLKNHCVRVYRKADRKQLFTIPRDPNNRDLWLYQPTNLAVDQAGRVYVSDTGDYGVKVFDAEGTYLRRVGGEGLGPGQFALCKGVAVDRESRLYVVDAKTQVVQLFDDQGRLLMYFGDPKTTGGGATSLPAGIAVDYDHVKYFDKFAAPDFKIEYLVVLANQMGNRKISVFGFGQKH